MYKINTSQVYTHWKSRMDEWTNKDEFQQRSFNRRMEGWKRRKSRVETNKWKFILSPDNFAIYSMLSFWTWIEMKSKGLKNKGWKRGKGGEGVRLVTRIFTAIFQIIFACPNRSVWKDKSCSSTMKKKGRNGDLSKRGGKKTNKPYR